RSLITLNKFILYSSNISVKPNKIFITRFEMDFINSQDGLWESDINIESVKRYSRQMVVPGIGIEGQMAISRAKVLVVGAGGLGSPVITYLAMAGIGELGIADYDRVELHNLQRQSIHTEDMVGEYKTRSAVGFIRKINRTVKVVEHCVAVDVGNIKGIIGGYEVIVDCSDNAKLRYVINDACREMGKDLVCGSVLRWEGQVFILSRTGSCFRCIFPVPKESAANCDQSGVVGPMCGVIGSMQAVEVMKVICARDRGVEVK
ncbi:adenylyltransferase and sulfurtransferase, partial [Pancytospora epiphaga]